MWLPTKLNALRSCCLLGCFGMLLLLAGCGYKLAFESTSLLGDGSSTIKVKGIENPTMNPALTYIVRSQLRDELANRQMAVWVDDGVADYEIKLIIENYTVRSHVQNDEKRTLLYTVRIDINAQVYDGRTNAMVWQSGATSYADNYDVDIEDSAAAEVSKIVIQRICDRLRHAF